MPRLVGPRLGAVKPAGGERQVDTTVEATPSVLFDAVVLRSDEAAKASRMTGRPEFMKDQYRHCKPMLVMGACVAAGQGGIPADPSRRPPDPGLIARPTG